TYDLTRGASPTIVRLVSKFLGPQPGRSVVDVAGGTGNYAQVFQARGFEVVVVDAEPAMVARSVPKIGPGRQVVGEASALPFGDERVLYSDTADGSLYALHVNALHLAGPAYLRNTTFWYQLDPETRRRGLEALAAALRSGELAGRVKEHFAAAVERGHETAFAA